ncbi:hypothetical protein RFI_31030, partial [Reticulomyxa filosa]
ELELRRQQEEVKLYHKCIRLNWIVKLSTLPKTYIYAAEVGIPDVQPDQYPYSNKLPMQITKLPHSSKSPFEKWKGPTSEEILNSLDESTIAIFADGSCRPEDLDEQGITTMIGSEIEAIRQALEKVQFQYKDERVLILSGRKFAVNAILNKCNSEAYNFSIAECQRLMKELGDNGVSEIYWTKGHSGIPGNNEQMQRQRERDFKQSS